MNEVFEQLTQRDIFMLLCGGGMIAGLSLLVSGLVKLFFVARTWVYRKIRRVRKPKIYYSFDKKPTDGYSDDYEEYCKAYKEGRYYPDPRD